MATPAALALVLLAVSAVATISPAEAGGLEPRHGGAGGGAMLLRTFDADGAGTVTAEEMQAPVLRLVRLDHDRDGGVDRDDRPARDELYRRR